jgi:cytoskeletal protein RodZ
MRHGLLALPLALALIAPGGAALAANTTTGYSQVTPPPKTTSVPTTSTEPTSTSKGEVSPTSTSNTPTSSTPASSNSEPTATTATKASAKTLPFTGLDLRWVILGGVLLVGMGMSILVVQRGRSTSR